MAEIIEDKKDRWADYQPPDLAKFVGEAPLYTRHTMRLAPFSSGFHESTWCRSTRPDRFGAEASPYGAGAEKPALA